MADEIRGIHLTLLFVLFNKCDYYEMLYVYPSQSTLLKWVKVTTGIKRCRRSLNYILRRLEDNGLIKRIQRSHNDRVLGHVFQSTLYKMTKKGLLKIQRFGIQAFKIIERFKKVKSDAKNKYLDLDRSDLKNGSLTKLGEIIDSIGEKLKPP